MRNVAQAAKTTLAKLPGKDVDADLLARLPQATGKTRQALIELAGQRQIDGALPAIMPSVEDADAGDSQRRRAGDRRPRRRQAGGRSREARSEDPEPRERGDIEKALLAISGRSGAACVPHLLPLMQSSDAALRMVGLHAMAIVGGPEALAAVKSALDDKDESRPG